MEDVYVVVFRSLVKPEIDRGLLRELDRQAHQEAVESGGLLDYVAGSDHGAKASVCVWESKDDAKRAAALPWHSQAAAMASQFYEWYEIKTF